MILIELVEVMPIILFWTIFIFNILCIIYGLKKLVCFIGQKRNIREETDFSAVFYHRRGAHESAVLSD